MIKLIEVIQENKKYDIALFTTFTLDIDFFETFIVKSLYANNIKSISLFVDGKQFREAITNSDSTMLGKYYSINPIEMNGAFHPKIVLLMSEIRAQVVVLSANLTLNGYCFNSEIYQSFIYEKGKNENSNIVKQAVELFKSLNEISVNKNDELIDKMYKIYSSYGIDSIESDHNLIHNLNNSIYAQTFKKINEIEKIMIAVPYYDKETLALKNIKDFTKCEDIELFIQNKESTYPIDKINDNYLFSVFEKCNNSKAFYHGKVLLFKTKKDCYILYGSSNCTINALFKAYKDNGNIECAVFEKGDYNTLVKYFDHFNKVNIDKNKIKSKSITFKPINNNYLFLYGEKDKNIELHLKCEYKESLSIFYNEKQLDYKRINGGIIVIINTDQIDCISPTFTITIKEGDVQNNIMCWFIDKEELKLNRIKKSINIEKLSKFVFKDTDYFEYYAQLLSFQEIVNELRINNYLEYQHLNDSTVDLDNAICEDETQINDGISSYVNNTNIYKSFFKYKELRNSELKKLLIYVKIIGKKSVESNIEELKYIPTNKEYNRQTASPIKKYIKRICKIMSDSSIYKNTLYEDYFAEISILLNLLNSLKNDKVNKNIFNIYEYTSLEILLIKSLLNITNTYSLKEEDKEIIIIYSLKLIAILMTISKDKNSKEFINCENIVHNLFRLDFINNDIDKTIITNISNIILTEYNIEINFTRFNEFLKNAYDKIDSKKRNHQEIIFKTGEKVMHNRFGKGIIIIIQENIVVSFNKFEKTFKKDIFNRYFSKLDD